MESRILLGIIKIVIIGLFISGYLNLSTVNSTIETARELKL